MYSINCLKERGLCTVENDKKKRLRNLLKTYERPLADFCHSLHVQVVKIPKKNNPISSDR